MTPACNNPTAERARALHDKICMSGGCEGTPGRPLPLESGWCRNYDDITAALEAEREDGRAFQMDECTEHQLDWERKVKQAIEDFREAACRDAAGQAEHAVKYERDCCRQAYRDACDDVAGNLAALPGREG